jgi:hypothetical protein
LWGFALDSVTFARQSFLEACEILVVVCELNDDIEGQAAVDKATIACGVFSIVQGCFRPSHDEEFAQQRYVSV